MAIADSTAFGYLADADYTTPGLIDTGCFVAYLAIALAAVRRARSPGGGSPGERSSPTLASLAAPLLVVLLTLSVVAAKIHVGDPLDRTSRVAAVVLIVARPGAAGPPDPARSRAPAEPIASTLRRRVERAALERVGVPVPVQRPGQRP